MCLPEPGIRWFKGNFREAAVWTDINSAAYVLVAVGALPTIRLKTAE